MEGPSPLASRTVLGPITSSQGTPELPPDGETGAPTPTGPNVETGAAAAPTWSDGERKGRRVRSVPAVSHTEDTVPADRTPFQRALSAGNALVHADEFHQSIQSVLKSLSREVHKAARWEGGWGIQPGFAGGGGGEWVGAR